jgi:hypothetical protein
MKYTRSSLIAILSIFLALSVVVVGIAGAVLDSDAANFGNDSTDQTLSDLNHSDQVEMKTIGVIGGVSWVSSIEYYRLLN